MSVCVFLQQNGSPRSNAAHAATETKTDYWQPFWKLLSTWNPSLKCRGTLLFLRIFMCCNDWTDVTALWKSWKQGYCILHPPFWLSSVEDLNALIRICCPEDYPQISEIPRNIINLAAGKYWKLWFQLPSIGNSTLGCEIYKLLP